MLQSRATKVGHSGQLWMRSNGMFAPRTPQAIDIQRNLESRGESVVTPIVGTARAASLSRMVDHSAHAARLRKMAEKCRRLAANMTDECSIAELRQMAVEYEAKANRIDRRHPESNPQPPIQL